jgi:hypothetical protein
MNKFRNNLHPAFFYGDSDPSVSVDNLNGVNNNPEVKKVVNEIKEQITEQEFPNLA